MRIRFGIMAKLFVWYFAIFSISFGMMMFFFMYIQKIMRVSDEIVNRKYIISSNAKNMIDGLFYMEENERKYDVLKKTEYIEYFVSAQKAFEGNLLGLIRLEAGTASSAFWEELYKSYQAQLPAQAVQPSEAADNDSSSVPWIPEEVLNDWIKRISAARSENERQVEGAMVSLLKQGKMAVRWGAAGLAFTCFVGAVGAVFLTYSMNRPLQGLRGGIRAFSREGPSDPIKVLSNDEFGELAQTFNEMTARLKEEEHLRSDFISMLSHEIRTPLTSIRESVNLIAEEVMGPINERQRRFLDIASVELDRISNLLNHLMQVSRIEVGALNVFPAPMDPSLLVSNSVYRLAPAAESKGIKIVTRLAEGIPEVMGDREHLQQVLLNLLGNAIKFSPPGSEVTIRLDYNEDRTMARFSVEDNGPGVPEEERPLIFHKYYRASGMRNQVDGVGLGLSISKYIVEAHGGVIWVDGREGRGSAFGFTIPFAVNC
ncbi:MAG: ATP-binding protein [Syntrophobacteraceae bacterium]